MKIGILLPSNFDLGLLRRARQLSLLVEAMGPDHSAAMGLPELDERQWRRVERELRADNPKTVVRRLIWEPVPVDKARRMFANLPPSLDLDGIEEVVVPRDWGWNFQDCDAVVVFADAGLGAVLLLVPTIFYCADLPARIVPEAFASSIDDPYWQKQVDAFRIWRQSAVLTSDPFTAEDLIGYAGVRRDRVSVGPNLLGSDAPEPASTIARDPTALAWLISSAALDDLAIAAAGLEMYMAEDGLMRPLVLRDTSRHAEREFASAELERLPGHLADLLFGLPTLAVSSSQELFRTLSRCGALWSSRVAGGEGEAPLLAAQTGLAFVGADYGVNRATVEATAVAAKLYPLNDAAAIADSLHELESLVEQNRRPKPVQPSADGAAQLWAVIERAIGAGSARH